MNDTVERRLKELVQEERLKEPDYGDMWERIARKRLAAPGPAGGKRRSGKKLGLIGAAVLVMLTIAIPAGASWQRVQLWNPFGSGGEKADPGLGQTIEARLALGGTEISLHQAVADDERVVLSYSIKPDSAAVENPASATFSQLRMTDDQGREWPVRYSNRWDAQAQEMRGTIQTDLPLPKRVRQLNIQMNDIRWLNTKYIPVPIDVRTSGTQVYDLSEERLGEIRIDSVQLDEQTLTVVYRLPSADADQDDLNPVLTVTDGERELAAARSVIGPPDGKEGTPRVQSFRLDGTDPGQLRFQLAYPREQSVSEGEWSFTVAVEPSELWQSSYVQNVSGEVLHAYTTLFELKNVKISPLQIRVAADKKNMPDEAEEWVSYDKVELLVGDRTIEGGVFDDGSHKTYFGFTPNESFIWAGEPVTMVLREARIEKKAAASEIVSLPNISERPQTLATELAGYPIRLTYYTSGNDLIIESESPNPNFGGIVQTYIEPRGKRIYSKDRQPGYGLPGSVGNKRAAVFSGFAGDSVQLHLFLYTILDPDRKVEIPLIR